MINEKTYLGDGLYAEFDGYMIRLSASNGIFDTNAVYLEPKVLIRFLDYIEKIGEKKND